jgi:hypothetical protein
VDEGITETGCILTGNKAAEEQGNVAAPDTERSPVGQGTVRDILGPTSLDEVDVGDEDGDPGQDTEDGGQVDKVSEDLARVIRHVHEGQESEDGADKERRPRHTTTIGLLEDGRGGLVTGKTVEGTAGNVQIGVGGGEDEDEDTGVDDVGEDRDTSKPSSHDKGRSVGTGTGLLVGESELRRVIGDNHAHEEDT